MNLNNEHTQKPNFDPQSFANNLLDTLDEGDEIKIAALLKLDSDIAVPFKQFGTKFDKQASLLKHIFSPRFQKYALELRTQIQTLFLRSLDYTVRDFQVHPSDQEMLKEIYQELLACQTLSKAKLANRVEKIVSKSYMYCYEVIEDLTSTHPESSQEIFAIFKQIRDLLSSLGFYNYAIFFSYILYRFCQKESALEPLVNLLELIIVHSKETELTKSFRTFCFKELRSVKLHDIQLILHLLEACYKLTDDEKVTIVEFVASASIPNENKFYYYLRILWLKPNMPVSFPELIRLSQQINSVHPENFTILESLVSTSNLTHVNSIVFLSIHDALASKNNMPTITSKYTQYKCFEEYALNHGNEYQNNIAPLVIMQTLTCACFSKNFKIIDKMINDLLDQLNKGGLSIDNSCFVLFDWYTMCVFDEVYDYLAEKYSNNDTVTLILLRSYSIETIKHIHPNDFAKWLNIPGMLKLFIRSLQQHRIFAEHFLNKLENLPSHMIAKRIVFLNEKIKDHDFILNEALRCHDDQLALRLYKLGARKHKYLCDHTLFFGAVLSSGCIQLATHLLIHDKNIKENDNDRQEQEKALAQFKSSVAVEAQESPVLMDSVLSAFQTKKSSLQGTCFKELVLGHVINGSYFWITTLPALNETEANFLLHKMIDKPSDPDPMENLYQGLMLRYLLQACPSVKQSLVVSLARSANYLLVRELMKKHNLEDNSVPAFFRGIQRPNLHGTLLLLKKSKTINCLSSRNAWPCNTAASNQIIIDSKGIREKLLPVKNSNIVQSNEIFKAAIKSKLLSEHPYTATFLIKLLALKQDEANDDEKLPIDELYLIFDKYILQGDFTSPVLAYLFLSFPMLSSEDKYPTFSGENHLSLRTFQLISVAYGGSPEEFRKLVDKITPITGQFMKFVFQLKMQPIFIEKLSEFLIRIRPEDAELIRSKFSSLVTKPMAQELQKTYPINQNPADRFEQAFKENNAITYSSLVGEFPAYFHENKLSHVLKLCSIDGSKILEFLFKQHKLNRASFTPGEMTTILKEIIITNISGENIALALKYNISDPECTATTASEKCLYVFALEQGKYLCADHLMPTFINRDLLIATAKFGNATLFQRALNANSRLQSRSDCFATYQELESICMNDKNKLTVIALNRINTRDQYLDEFGASDKKIHYKIKNKNPSGEELFADFKHQLELLKSYATTDVSPSSLNPNDLKACSLALKTLVAEYQRCGHKIIKLFLQDDALFGQLIPFVQSIEQELKKLAEDEQLPEAIIHTQLEIIISMRSKQVIEVQVAQTPEPSKKNKKKKKHVAKKKAVETGTKTPLVISERNGLYEFFELKKAESVRATDLKEETVDQELVASSHLSDSLLAINSDIENILDAMHQFVSNIANVDELQVFSDQDTSCLMEHYAKLKQLFWELDDDLDESSPFCLYKAQLQLLDCSQKDEDTKKHVTLLAKQLLFKTKQQLQAPVKVIEKEKTASSTFFQPAILQEDINKFCLKRLDKLSTLVKAASDMDAIHFCVFRIVNALGDLYRPARMVRHILIHEFYNIASQDLLALAKMLLKIDLADRKSFLAIEHSALFEQSQGLMHRILRPGKREKFDLQAVLCKKLQQVVQCQEERKNDNALWHTLLVGELAKQIDICSEIKLSKYTETQCQIIRNKVAHEDYKQSLINDNAEVICNVPIARVETIAKTFKNVLVISEEIMEFRI